MNNGEGLRVVLWLSGCSHNCKGCQNPQTWDAKSGIHFDENAKEELFKELEKDYISGITLTGGDPLHRNNLKEVLLLLEEIKSKYPNKSIWLYTGYVFEDIFNKIYGTDYIDNYNVDFLRQVIIYKCDVLVDGTYIEEQRDVTLKWRGSSNQRVIDVKESLEQNTIVLHCD